MSKNVTTVVESAVNAAVEGSMYASYPEVGRAKTAIAEALSENVEQACNTLRSIAAEAGLSESLVENALIESGLVDEPEPEVEETEESGEPTNYGERLDKIETTLAEVLTIARRYGYTG